ncbi:hypothetical protein GCM10009802_00140 [Streptomyces synnematoformans]|uniref:Uncharacterized protein n=1 Tax=Streptomyces synnematoformans TaxID=415721 RepID=A0ABN2X7D3_9ACTN
MRQVFVEAEGRCLCEMQGVAAAAGVGLIDLRTAAVRRVRSPAAGIETDLAIDRPDQLGRHRSAHSDEIAEQDRRSAVRVSRRPAEGSQRPSVRLSWALFMDERPWMLRRRASA